MRIIRNTSLDPYGNLAAEEVLLEGTDDIFMLWQNSPSVIIGKNQNAWAEVDTDFTEAAGISVVRRLTGGGAVFHDPGNVNFTFITDASDSRDIDFAPFIQPVIRALASFGIAAEADGRNDIIAGGRKISGNAQCRHRTKDGRERLLHHGTLLYDADLTALSGSLRVNGEKLRSKGIRSVSSRVGNIKELGGLSMSAGEFANCLAEYGEKLYGVPSSGFTEVEMRDIAALAQAKYSAWEWNFGGSPEYGKTVTERFPWGTLTVDITVDRGVIKGLRFTGDFFGTESVSAVEDAVLGCPYREDDLCGRLSLVPVGKIFFGAEAEDIIKLILKEL